MTRDLYPRIEPYDTGMLDVGDGDTIYWEASGNPDGRLAVALHGGPGSGTSPFWRRLFDPDRYHIVCFDQRGCGQGTPNAADPGGVLATNTTRLAGIPGLMVDGWLDVSGPPDIAWSIARHWPDAERIIVSDAGHGHGVDGRVVAATDRFAG